MFVVAFAVYPIAAALFREADVPKRLVPGAIALGSFTFTTTALPGTPQIQNAIPMPFFGTDPFAAPGLGIIGGAVMLIGGMLWLNGRAKRAQTLGEGYGDHVEERTDQTAPDRGPSFSLAIVPIILVILLNFVYTKFIIPSWDVAFLAEDKFGNTSIDAVRGIWSIICALVIAIVIHRWGLGVGIVGGAILGLAIYGINMYSLTYFFDWFFAIKSNVFLFSHVLFGATAGGVYELFDHYDLPLIEEADK